MTTQGRGSLLPGEAEGQAVTGLERFPLDGIGKPSHEGNSQSAGNEFVDRSRSGRGRGRGGIEGMEMRGSVFNDEGEPAIAGEGEPDLDGVAGVVFVAVADDVGDSFFKAEVDGENSLLGKIETEGERLKPGIDQREVGEAAAQGEVCGFALRGARSGVCWHGGAQMNQRSSARAESRS